MATEVVADSLGDEWKVSHYNMNRVCFQHCNISFKAERLAS